MQHLYYIMHNESGYVYSSKRNNSYAKTRQQTGFNCDTDYIKLFRRKSDASQCLNLFLKNQKEKRDQYSICIAMLKF